MKVLVLSHVFPPTTGGSGRWLWELYRRLSDITVGVVAGDAAGAESFDSTALLPITRLHLNFGSWGVLSPRALFDYVRGAMVVNRIARQNRADVIHCGKSLPEGLIAAAVCRWRGLPFLCYAHGEELALAKTSRELRILAGWVFRSATAVIANSDHTRRMLIDQWRVPSHRVTVLHPGVDTARFRPADRSVEVRGRLGWTGRRVVLTVGALQKRKGQDTMIRALPAIRVQCPDVLYAVAGEGWERRYLETLANEFGVGDLVQFRGVPTDDELVEHYQQCDLFALPNRQVGWDFEGFGIALLEAQACGRPVLAGASGGAPETLSAGITGEVVDCERPEPLAAAVVALLSDAARRESMGRSARQWVEQRFDWTVLARQARRLFTEAPDRTGETDPT